MKRIRPGKTAANIPAAAGAAAAPDRPAERHAREGKMKVEAYRRNRRDFIKATAAASVGAASEASAQQASTPWIGFIHSTRLDETWQPAFFEGLREQKWEGDPSENLQYGLARVAVKKFEAGGKYKSTDLSNLSRAIAN